MKEHLKLVEIVYQSIYQNKWILVDNKVLNWVGYKNTIDKYNKRNYLELVSSKFVKEKDYKILSLSEFNDYGKTTLNIMFELDPPSNNRHTYIIMNPRIFKESIMLLKTDGSTYIQKFISNRELVKYKNCSFIGCYNVSSSFLNENGLIYCSAHTKQTNMNINSISCALCYREPSYNYRNELKATHCNEHKKEGMINIKAKYCELCKYNQVEYGKKLCCKCFYFENPNEVKAINYKVKENIITRFIKEKYSNCVLDSVIKGGCSKRRPDCLIDFISYCIIIEIDEDRHSRYDTLCENKRLMEIYMDLGLRPIVFIRFNPDSYIDELGNLCKSIFIKEDNTVKVRCHKELNRRIHVLITTIENEISKMNKCIEFKAIEIIKLFY